LTAQLVWEFMPGLIPKPEPEPEPVVTKPKKKKRIKKNTNG